MSEFVSATSTRLELLSHSLHLAGFWGVWSMMALFALSGVSILPRPMLCVLVGSVYGFLGIPIALAGSLTGAVAAFCLGSMLRGRLGGKLTQRWQLVALALDTIRGEGWRIVLLCRLSPIAPSSIQSLLFGASSVRFLPYITATALGILPGIALEVFLGSQAREALSGNLSQLRIILLSIGLGAGFAALILVGRKLRETLLLSQPVRQPLERCRDHS